MRSRHAALLMCQLALVPVACADGSPASAPDDDGIPSSDQVPLTDLDAGVYLGRYEGGLYPDGSDVPPPDHEAAGRERAARIQPLDVAGRPDPHGKIVLLSIGMSNTSQEYCGSLGVNCVAWSFVGQATADPVVDLSDLAIVNGAQGGETADEWDRPSEPAYDRVRDGALVPNGLDERQVQVVWLKEAHAQPRVSLPASGADAYTLEQDLGEIVRALVVRYPNLQLVFVSSRTYGGYATTTLNPEPYAYESGFSVKWLIEAQIRQSRTGVVDPLAGDLAFARYPWVGWGPYLWTAGTDGRSDGLTWQPEDVQVDGTHPSASGERKVGELLLDFFTNAPVARCWFVEGLTCRS